MKTKKEINRLLNQWQSLVRMLDDERDAVSILVVKQASGYIETLKWVLEK